MKIAFDAKRILHNRTGLGNYGRTLITDLSSIVPTDTSLDLYAPDAGENDLRKMVKHLPHVAMHYAPYGYNGLAKAWWRSHGVVKQLVADGADVFHGLSGELPIGIKRTGIRSVVTIHDLIFMRHPEYYNPVDAWLYKQKFRLTCREARCIVAISQCTKRDIVELGHISPDRVKVVYQGCSPRFRRVEGEDKREKVHTAYSLPQRYVVCVGTIEERKNALLAVEALNFLPQDISLVIVGRATKYTEKVRRYVADNKLQTRVKILTNVPHDDLPAIYQMAEVCAYPSRYEGFGIPVIEGIQSGLPVVAATGSCLEEAGGPDSQYVSPDDPRAMAAAIDRVLKGRPEREGRIERARQYVTRFENHHMAEEIYQLYLQ